MPRGSSRLPVADVIAAATSVFQFRGLEQAQMTQVAQGLGVTAGNLYNYVDGKETLYWWCLQAAGQQVDYSNVELPLTAPPRDAVLKEAGVLLHRVAAFPSLQRAVDVGVVAGADVEAEVRQIVAEFYDANVEFRDLLMLVERSARTVPELYEIFYTDFRGGALRRLEQYLADRAAAGHLAGHTSTAVAARAIVETTAWFARHRLGDPDGRLLDADACRETVIEMCTKAVLP